MTSPDQVRKYAAGEMGDANLMLAKLTAHNNGKVTAFTDTNPITNPAGPAPITMTTTPGEDSTAATARAGQAVTLAGQRSTAQTAANALAQGERHFGETKNNAQKAPAGYTWGPPGADGSPTMIAVKGGPADLKIVGALNADTQALSGSTAGLDRLGTAANEALSHPGLKSTYGLRGVVPNIPGSQAADAAALLNTLKSQVGFSVLQDMRNNSKTGGTLGSVSDKENLMLQANLAALEKAQSFEQAQESLKKIVKYSEDAKGRLRSAYNMRHGDKTAAGVDPDKPAAGGNSVTTPDGNVHTFPNAAAAAQFRKAAGL